MFEMLLPLLFLCLTTDAAAQQYEQGYIENTTIAGNGTGVDSNGKYTIRAPSIVASFIPLGATLTNLVVPDQNGTMRDVILGYDSWQNYSEPSMYPGVGSVPGRYASPIANDSFIADGINSTISLAGQDWSQRNWTVFAETSYSITFYLSDPAVKHGMPGAVVAWVTYTVTELQLNIRMVAISLTDSTPIMMSSKTYWNLDGFANPDDQTILNHTLWLPYSGQRTDVDTDGNPPGIILPNQLYAVNDFWSGSGKPIGHNLTSKYLKNNCGRNCTGYDNNYMINRAAAGPYDWTERGPVAVLRSKWTGLRMNIFTDQDAIQVDTCNRMNGSTQLKSGQGVGRLKQVAQYGCVGLHVKDWLDGVNQPEWGRSPKQLYGPGDAPYTLQAMYQFKLPQTTPHCTSTRSFSSSSQTSRTISRDHPASTLSGRDSITSRSTDKSSTMIETPMESPFVTQTIVVMSRTINLGFSSPVTTLLTYTSTYTSFPRAHVSMSLASAPSTSDSASMRASSINASPGRFTTKASDPTPVETSTHTLPKPFNTARTSIVTTNLPSPKLSETEIQAVTVTSLITKTAIIHSQSTLPGGVVITEVIGVTSLDTLYSTYTTSIVYTAKAKATTRNTIGTSSIVGGQLDSTDKTSGTMTTSPATRARRSDSSTRMIAESHTVDAGATPASKATTLGDSRSLDSLTSVTTHSDASRPQSIAAGITSTDGGQATQTEHSRSTVTTTIDDGLTKTAHHESETTVTIVVPLTKTAHGRSETTITTVIPITKTAHSRKPVITTVVSTEQIFIFNNVTKTLTSDSTTYRPRIHSSVFTQPFFNSSSLTDLTTSSGTLSSFDTSTSTSSISGSDLTSQQASLTQSVSSDIISSTVMQPTVDSTQSGSEPSGANRSGTLSTSDVSSPTAPPTSTDTVATSETTFVASPTSSEPTSSSVPTTSSEDPLSPTDGGTETSTITDSLSSTISIQNPSSSSDASTNEVATATLTGGSTSSAMQTISGADSISASDALTGTSMITSTMTNDSASSATTTTNDVDSSPSTGISADASTNVASASQTGASEATSTTTSDTTLSTTLGTQSESTTSLDSLTTSPVATLTSPQSNSSQTASTSPEPTASTIVVTTLTEATSSSSGANNLSSIQASTTPSTSESTDTTPSTQSQITETTNVNSSTDTPSAATTTETVVNSNEGTSTSPLATPTGNLSVRTIGRRPRRRVLPVQLHF